MMTGRERVLAAIEGRPVDRTPRTPIVMAWGAHQIGRTYRDYYLDAEVLAAAQLNLARSFGIDQVSAISDPWREATGFGMEFDYPAEGVGVPRGHLLTDDHQDLRPFDPMQSPRTRDRIDAIRQMSREVGSTHSVLGWVEGPLAEYVDLRGLEGAMMDLMDDPARFHRAADVIVQCAVRFAELQIEAGADTIGVGDAACSLISPDIYEQHILPWQQNLFAAIHTAGAKVKLHICGDTRRVLPFMAKAAPDVIDLDWMVPIPFARETVRNNTALAGNLDPVEILLRGTAADVRREVHRCLTEGVQRFLLQPGCEVPAGTSIENFAALMPE